MVVETTPFFLDRIFPTEDGEGPYFIGYDGEQASYEGPHYLWTDKGGWNLVSEVPSGTNYSKVISEKEIKVSEDIREWLYQLDDNKMIPNMSYRKLQGYPEVDLVTLYTRTEKPRPNFENISHEFEGYAKKMLNLYKLEGLISLFVTSGSLLETYTDETSGTAYAELIVDFFNNNSFDSKREKPHFLHAGDVFDWLRKLNTRVEVVESLSGLVLPFWTQLCDGYKNPVKQLDILTKCVGRSPRDIMPDKDSWEFTFEYARFPGMKMIVSDDQASVFMPAMEFERDEETTSIGPGDKVQIVGRDECFIVTQKNDDLLTIESGSYDDNEIDLPRFIFEKVEDDTELSTNVNLTEFLDSENTDINLMEFGYITNTGQTVRIAQWIYADGYRYMVCDAYRNVMLKIYAPMVFGPMLKEKIVPMVKPKPTKTLSTGKDLETLGPNTTALAAATIFLFVIVYNT